ncbi:uncharacterized protein PG998_013879 [Apiospora kogelbergensis]|uniref:uncharacterized protein n=1 Tax=Apiospora kogelbergensis TaxID=1337665 RepID=UPI003132129F
MATAQAASTKRKRSEPPAPSTAATATTTTTATTTSSKRPRLASALNIIESSDAKIVAAVESKYDVQTHSVISSSKIQKKVSSVLRHLQQTTPKTSSPERPRVSVLRARASDAGKLISIAEIAKREMLMSGGRQNEAKRWYQYVALGSETKEGEGKTVIEDTVLGRQGQASRELADDDDNHEPLQQEKDNEEDDGEDDDFEKMKTPFERAIESTPKMRAAPVMSLFLSLIPIDELRRRYGEQTSDDPADT